MKPIALILVSTAAAAVTSFAVVRLSQCCESSAPPPAPTDPGLTAAIERIAAQQSKLERDLADLKNAAPLAEPASARIPLGEIEAAVARALEARSQPGAPVEVAASAVASAAPKKHGPRASYDRLDGLDWDAAQGVWKEIAAAGELDEVVAMFEANAKAKPNDAEAQVELGHAYLQKLFHSGAGGPESGVWAMKADSAFDSALKIDDQNWSARFSKAMSLSHWPPVFGKQTEAIKHFEILVQQQENMKQKPEFAQTHFLLGNMYQQLGDKDRARAAWQAGLAHIPDDEDLAQQIANLSPH
jgi:tetratricopeptide (TPR) repeat protein